MKNLRNVFATITLTALSLLTFAEEYPNTTVKRGLFYQVSIENQSCQSKSVCDWFQTIEQKENNTFLGVYDKFKQANKIANRLEEVGYQKASTESFFNGRKITIEQAAILSQSLLSVDGPRTWGGKELNQQEIDEILFANGGTVKLEYRMITAPTADDYDMSFVNDKLEVTEHYNQHGFKYYEIKGFNSKAETKAYRQNTKEYIKYSYVAAFYEDKMVSYSLAEIFENL